MRENLIYFLLVVFLTLLLGVCQVPWQEKISYNQHVRPILNKNCLSCHGGVKKNGGFSLLFEEEAFDTTDSGYPAIIPGDAQNSELVKRLHHHDPEMRMPQEANPLTPEEIAVIEKWIDQGAKWEEHWAYIPPDTNIVPPDLTPGDRNANEIDAFILRRLKNEELTFAKEASSEVLLRRLSLDITGLPPTESLLKTYQDAPPEEAYERAVDHLMDSPQYGEKWASMWLDLARYADSKGYEKDLNRSIWKYRDWVIDAYNRDLPFDKFTVEQLAGDLLPQPSVNQLIATAFHRNTIANDEGGTDDEEFRVAAQIERVGTTWETWMGTTMACVQCHSHPYDPFRQVDFYQSMAFFNNTADKDIYNEAPRVFTYEDSTAGKVNEILAWIEDKTGTELSTGDRGFLYQRVKHTMDQFDYLKWEAEDYHGHSRFIELTSPDQLSVFQIQDSSWIMYENVPMEDIQQISLRVASAKAGGWIEIFADSLFGKKLATLKVPVTGKWDQWKQIRTNIAPVDGVRDLYFFFRMGNIPETDLFRLDWIQYHKGQPNWQQYGPELRDKLASLYEIPKVATPILRDLEGENRRQTFVFQRGNWLTPGQEILPGLPEVMPGLPGEAQKDRLAFAKWLTDRNHPLTSRVYVNRIWAEIFGIGLVETVEDFGTQGTPPSHPELLDWLAVNFSHRQDWSTKSLIKLLVMSAAYRQESSVSEELLEKDPANRLLARGPRVRLSAEEIRDQALAVSGLLDSTMHGPPVLLNHPDARTRDPYRQASLIDYQPHRRAIYNFWKRTIPTAYITTFDGPTRDICVSRRIRTNTPLQALVMLNDSVFFRAAEALGAWMEGENDKPETVIARAYEKVMFRPPDSIKLAVLVDLYEDAGSFSAEEEKPVAMKVANTSEEAPVDPPGAYTIVANALLNMDEFITKF